MGIKVETLISYLTIRYTYMYERSKFFSFIINYAILFAKEVIP